MARLGYIPSDAWSQNCAAGLALLEAATDRIYRCDIRTGSMRKIRDELYSIIEHLGVGDELIVLRLDHIARSARDVLEIVQEILARDASLRILEPELTTLNGMDRPLVAALKVLADLETQVAKYRRRVGIEAGRARGSYKGRMKSVDDDEICRRVAAGESKAAIARAMRISRVTIYRAIGARTGDVGPGDRPDAGV